MNSTTVHKLLSVLLVVLILVLTGCQTAAPAAQPPAGTPATAASPQPAPKQPVEITLAGWQTVEWTQETMDWLFTRFTEKTGIKVKYLDFPYSDVQGKYTAAATGGGEVYDVMATEVSWNVALYNAGYLEKLQPYLDKEPAYAKTLTLDLYSMRTNGQLTGICGWNHVYHLLYNIDLFKKYDIKVPTSWAEFVEAARQFKAKAAKDGIYPTAEGWGAQAQVMTRTWGPRMVSLGGNFLDKDRNATINSKEAIQAVADWKALYDEPGLLAPNSLGNQNTVPREMFTAGQIAMFFDTPAVVPIMKVTNPNLNVGMAPPWTNPNGSGGYLFACSGWSISSKSTHKAEAWEYIKFMTSDEVSDLFVNQKKIMWATQKGLNLLEKMDDPVLKMVPLLARNDLTHNVAYPQYPNGTQLPDVFKNSFQEAISGKKDIQAALTEANVAWQKALDEERATSK